LGLQYRTVCDSYSHISMSWEMMNRKINGKQRQL